jgi:isoamylase
MATIAVSGPPPGVGGRVMEPVSASPTASGASHPLGATCVDDGVNFSVYAKGATGLDILLFDGPEDDAPSLAIELDRDVNRSGDYWHAFVPGVRAGQVYAFRATGPWEPETGLRFDGRRILVDPYGRGVAVPATYRRDLGEPTAGDVGRSMKSVVIDLAEFDWAGDRPLGHSLQDSVIYEAHVRGFTANPNSGLADEIRGTYAGFIERIPYLVELGVTAVELLPVFQFDALAAPPDKRNYWGYQPVSFFAPHAAYSSRPGAQGAVDEFRDLVKALHSAGIEVILDVVYNHTAETGVDGRTFSFRGLANADYYHLDPTDRSRYLDYSGTGNSLNANRSVVRRLILDSLRYWVAEMHVDGFRFDLAAVLSRDEDGNAIPRPPILWDIDTDPILAGTKLIAEAWDAAGLYQVGSFVGDRWIEWNGRFRDDVRSFIRGEPGKVWALGQRMSGSPDIYAKLGREAQKSVNFVTCHDGFTLADLVSYDHKHNEANGEENRDGSDQNLSWNCGIEGPTDHPEIEGLRLRQMRNFLVLELLAIGLPMLQMGDEVGRTQIGNNNAYCQDNESSWFDWALIDRNADMLAFTHQLISGRRRARDLLDAPEDLTLAELLESSHMDWHGVKLHQPDLSDESRSLAMTLWGRSLAMHVMFNAWWEPLEFELPSGEGSLTPWRRVIDTAIDGPTAFVPASVADTVDARSYSVGPRSVVLLASSPTGQDPAGAS